MRQGDSAWAELQGIEAADNVEERKCGTCYVFKGKKMQLI